MSVIRAKTAQYGPAILDIQIEQGADFVLPIQVTFNGSPVDLTGAEILAVFTPQWSPGQASVYLTVVHVDDPTGVIHVTFPAAESLALTLPFPPRKTKDPSLFELGGWVLHVTLSGSTFRYAEGRVVLDRAPWLT